MINNSDDVHSLDINTLMQQIQARNDNFNPQTYYQQNIVPYINNYDITPGQDTANLTDSAELPIDAMVRDVKAREAKEAQNKPDSSMTRGTTDIIKNFQNNIEEWGTGLNYLWVNKEDLIKQAPKAIYDYLTSKDLQNGPREIMTDIANAITSNYNIDWRTISDRDPADIVQGILAGMYTRPADFLADVVSLGGAGVAKKVLSKIPVAKKLFKAADVEKGIAAEGKDVAMRATKWADEILEADRLAKKEGASLGQLIEAAEEGTDIPKGTLDAFKALRRASDAYDDLAKVKAPGTYVGKENTAIVQKVLRDRLKVNPNATFQQVEKQLTPYLEQIGKNELSEVTEMAAKGDKVADEVVSAKKLFDEGRIFPVTHALAEVDKTADRALIYKAKATGQWEEAGKFSRRLYGTSSYEDIEKALTKNDDFMEYLINSYQGKAVAQALLKGEFAPAKIVAKAGEQQVKDARYLDRQLLEQGKIQEALKSARKEPLNLDDVAVDKDVLGPLSDQLGGSGAFSGVMNDFYQTGKGVYMAGLTYLGPNLITGVTNAMINSGPSIISDIVEAIKSQGRISKNLGTFRYNTKPKISSMPVLKQIDQMNSLVGKPARAVDRAMQNAFAEIAAHAELRKQGVKSAERMAALESMDKAKLGELITDVRRMALINSPKTILPKTANDLISTVSPFWRWYDTATQSSYRLLEKSPLLANVALLDIMGNIGFNKEMQNRLNLNVDLDKPYVTFKQDEKGQKKTISAEFIPLMTTLKLVDPKSWNANSNMVPVIQPIVNALGGIDRYGNPMKRPKQDSIITQTLGTKRYQAGPNTPWHEVQGKGDEILSTAIKSLVSYPTLWNRTIAPMLAPIISPTGQYYQPYDMSLFGGFSPDETNANIIYSANPTKGRTARDVMNSLGGVYEQDYNPQYEMMTPNKNRNLTRQFMRNQIRLQNEGR